MLVIISYIFTFLHLTYFDLCIIMILQEKRGAGVLQKNFSIWYKCKNTR